MKFAFAISGALAVTHGFEDDAALLSVSAVRNSIHALAKENSLNELGQVQDPRKVSELLQEFALNTVEAGVGIDADTREKLIAIRDILTNETYISLEQAHRHDQDLLSKHAQAINECGQKHIRHLQHGVEGLEVQLVRDTEDAMYKCRGLPHHSLAELQTEGNGDEETWRDHAADEYGNYDPDKDTDATWALKAVRSKPNEQQIQRGIWKSGDWTQQGHRFWETWSGVNNPKYDDPDWSQTGSCLAAHNDMFARCDALDAFIRGLPMPNCQPPVGTTEMEVPKCDGSITGVDSDLFDWFTNMKENALFYQGQWQQLKKACDEAREYYKEICLEECARKQRQYEQAFCSYRQGLHGTCREYQGCHVLNEEQFMDLVKTVMYNADSRKIDWKAIHKIECYINVLISTETNTVRAKDLLNCEAGNLNTIETILTGFNETNYLSLIVPEINVSCWDMDVPQYIDFKECDMTSVQQHPCTEDWMARYNGLIAPAECTECAPIPDDMQYTMEQDSHKGATSDEFGGGWFYVHEIGRSATDIDDLTDLAPGGYHLPKYVTGKLRWNEVLVERVSQNWCDSWGAQSSYWLEEGGASMCVQSDDEHVYCMNNAHDQHSWRQQPAAHFSVNCGREGQPACDCWPKNRENVCWAYEGDNLSEKTKENVEAPRHVRILSLKEDGSVVKISFQGEMKTGTLKVGNYNAFMQDAEGCRAITAVKYRVYVRCLGCAAEEADFHTKDGLQLDGAMTIGRMHVASRPTYTYEAWFKSPLSGKLNREIFGGANSGLTLANVGAVACMHDVGAGIVQGGKKESGYQLHAGGTDKWGSFCFEADTWYHVAVTKDDSDVKMYVNGRDVTADGHKLDASKESTLATSFGGGFGDGGQLFNVRIWNFARSQQELYQDAYVTRASAMSHVNGLDHWWPLTDDLKDVMTGVELSGKAARYAPLWCSDMEASGMRGCSDWGAVTKDEGAVMAMRAITVCFDADCNGHGTTADPTPEGGEESCQCDCTEGYSGGGCEIAPFPSIKLSTGRITAKPCDATFEQKVNRAVKDEPYCSTELESVHSYSNQRTCGGPNKNIAYKFEIMFMVDVPGQWEFDFNVDFGWGGVVRFDGKRAPEGYHDGDHWWSHNLNKAMPLDFIHDFTTGLHTIEVFGAEGCCDGTSNIRFKKPHDTEWQHLSLEALKEKVAVPSIKLSTGKISNRPSNAGFEHAVNHAVTMVPYGSKNLDTIEGYANKVTFRQSNRNIAYKIEVAFMVDTPGEWHFDMNVDFGWGGVVTFDGKRSPEGYHSGDHWWSHNLNKAMELDVAHTFDIGVHTMVVYGAEGCCDGVSNIRFMKPGHDWQMLSVAALQAIDGPVIVQR